MTAKMSGAQSISIFSRQTSMGLKAITIGTLARHAAVNVETIRFYQRRGLIPEPAKPLSGYRHYSPETVDRVRFIKRAQELGFTLKEIVTLLQLGDGHCRETKQLASTKLATIEARLVDLEAMRKVLKKLIQRCDKNTAQKGCPIVESLTWPSAPKKSC